MKVKRIELEGRAGHAAIERKIDGRRRRVTVPENDDAMLDTIAAELSPQAVAVIATRSNRSRQPTICRDLDVERQVQWFADRLIERLGGKQACARLLKELDA